MHKILVAYDGSESSKRALEEAAGLAGDGGTVTVVSVAEVLPQFGRAGALLVPEEDEERKRELAEAGALLSARGIATSCAETTRRRRFGSPNHFGGTSEPGACLLG